MTQKKRKYPTQEVDPENFLTNEEVLELLETKDDYEFTQEDYERLYNCVHCRECGTSDERVLLKQKFLKDGNTIEGLEEMKETFRRHGTPYKNNESRIKLPKDVKKESKTLLYFGCFTSVKTPRYGEHAAEYLRSKGVEFTVLEREICCGYPIWVTGVVDTYEYLLEQNEEIFSEKGFERIITVCPSCFMVFKEHYEEKLGIKVEYFTDYLEPAEEQKSGKVSIQHACPLEYDKKPEVVDQVENALRSSGYELMNIPQFCCGGGVGHQLRKDVSEAIEKIRVQDFKGDYVTYYCPDCFWFINVFGRRAGMEPQLRDIFKLLS